MEFFIFAGRDKQPGQGAGRGAALHVSFAIELAAVARAFKQLALGIPFLTASKVRAAVLKRAQASVGLPAHDPRACLGHMKGLIGLKFGEDVRGNLSAADTTGTVQGKPADAPGSHKCSHG